MDALLPRVKSRTKYPSQERLKECLRYDEETGLLYWIEVRQRRKLNEPAGTVRRKKTYGHQRESAYRYIGVDGGIYAAHRLAWIWNFGDIPVGMQIDHQDGDGLNNRIANLRLVTPAEQARNMARPTTNTSGYTGVQISRDRKYWTAIIGSKRIGTFGSKREAAERVASARLLLGYHENHGRD